eukprot:6726-Chlamydomonas_euryale.AAC.1
MPPQPLPQLWRGWRAATEVFRHGLTQDVHEGLEDDARVVRMHQAAEIFDPETEHVYKYLQVRMCGLWICRWAGWGVRFTRHGGAQAEQYKYLQVWMPICARMRVCE